jgi:hypothetical protein
MISKFLSIVFVAVVLVAGAAAQAPWQKIRSVEGKFVQDLPCAAEFKSDNLARSGQPQFLKSYSCLSGGVYYATSFTDLQGSFDIKNELNRNRDDFVKTLGAAVISERSIYSNTGIEFSARSSDKTAVVRFFFVGNRLYSLLVAKRLDTANVMENSKFFSSFALAG